MDRNVFDGEVKDVSNGGTTFDIEFRPISEFNVMVLEHISCANLTTDGSNVTIGVKRGAGIKWLKTLTLTTKNLYYALENSIELISGDYIVLRFRSTVNGDELQSFAFGYYLY